MAKNVNQKSGTARIKFIMLDAEIPEGDLDQITLAIQNALRPSTIIHNRVVTVEQTGTAQIGSEASAEGQETDLAQMIEEGLETGLKPSRKPVKEQKAKSTLLQPSWTWT